MSGDGEADRDHVVGEGEDEIAADDAEGAPRALDQLDDRSQSGPPEVDVGRREHRLGAAVHADADGGRRQRGGVVDAVADHGHSLAARALDRLQLVLRRRGPACGFGRHADLRGNASAPPPGGRRRVFRPRQPMARMASIEETLSSRSGSPMPATASTVPSTAISTGLRPSAAMASTVSTTEFGMTEARVSAKVTEPTAIRLSSDCSFDAGTWGFSNVARLDPGCIELGESPGDRVGRVAFQRRRRALQVFISPPADDRHPALGQGAGLVQHHAPRPGQVLERVAALDRGSSSSRRGRSRR